VKFAVTRRDRLPAARAGAASNRLAPWMRPLRLVDAVALAAGGLLVLKLVGLAFDDRPPEAPAPRPPVQARNVYDPLDPVVTGATTPKEEPKPTPGPVPVDPLPRPVQPMSGPTSGSPSERALLERLGERREALQGRNRDLDVRERLIENAEKRLEARIGDLKAAEERVEGGPAKRGEAEAAAIKNLVTMYETMKPKDAARVFDRLTLEVMVPVVLGMNPRKMAEVLALMQPEAAEKLTVALAMRARGLAEPPRAAAALPPGELQAIEPGR
jgi:flagellar motility protein MotE (MotC chaperone)